MHRPTKTALKALILQLALPTQFHNDFHAFIGTSKRSLY